MNLSNRVVVSSCKPRVRGRSPASRLAVLPLLAGLLPLRASHTAGDDRDLLCKVTVTLPKETELEDLINWMMSITCQKFIWDRKVRSGKVTIMSPEPVTVDEAYAAFYAALETMGLTETAAPSFSNPLDPARRKLGAVGLASGCEARVVDREQRPVPDGSTGEIVIRGPQVMRGYYKNDEATRAAFTADGWLRTGDLGHRDADGFFFVTGRIKELIIKGGENIAPREIDEVLLRHPAVLEAAVVSMPDVHYGQDILACVVLREGQAPDEAALRAFCTEHLGRYKTPRTFRFVRELPRGPSGKVQRLKLLD